MPSTHDPMVDLQRRVQWLEHLHDPYWQTGAHRHDTTRTLDRDLARGHPAAWLE